MPAGLRQVRRTCRPSGARRDRRHLRGDSRLRDRRPCRHRRPERFLSNLFAKDDQVSRSRDVLCRGHSTDAAHGNGIAVDQVTPAAAFRCAAIEASDAIRLVGNVRPKFCAISAQWSLTGEKRTCRILQWASSHSHPTIILRPLLLLFDFGYNQ
jgi:hypothetical protein